MFIHVDIGLKVGKARRALGETFCGRMRRLRIADAEVADGLQEGLEGVSGRRGGQVLLDALPHFDRLELDGARGDSLRRRRREADLEGVEVPALADHVEREPGRFRVLPAARSMSERESVDGQAVLEVDGDSAHVRVARSRSDAASVDNRGDPTQRGRTWYMPSSSHPCLLEGPPVLVCRQSEPEMERRGRNSPACNRGALYGSLRFEIALLSFRGSGKARAS